MVFHVRWIFLTTSLRIPPELLATSVGFGDESAFSRIFYTLIKLNSLGKVADHENHVRWIYLTTVLCMGESQKYVKTNETFLKK